MVVLDSSFVIAYYNERDVHHVEACAQMEALLAGSWGPGLLPEYVFVEVTTVLLLKRGLPLAREVAEILMEAQELELVSCAGFFQETMERFRNQAETLSFADAAVVTVALRHAQGKVLTFDKAMLRYPGVNLPAR